MCSWLLRPETVLPDVEELLAQTVNKVEKVAEKEDRRLVAATPHSCLSLLFGLLISNLLHQVLIARH